ncbi:nucleotidyl transferase AbiEii/AbiGii toxin family protein [Pseudomonas luteola]
MKNVGMSVRRRLTAFARAEKKDLNTLLHHYMVERLLFRLSQTDLGGMIVLKGAMLFSLWYEENKRTTRDADFLSLINPEDPRLKEALVQAMTMSVEDGMRFEADSIEAKEIKKENAYPGVRFLFWSYLDGARIRGQLDVSFNDFVTEKIPTAPFPVILNDQPVPNIPVYPMPTVIAEKIQTMCAKGEANSRLKDFFDVSMILSNEKLDSAIVQKAICGTFKHRHTDIPTDTPVALSLDFAQINENQWNGFVRKNQAVTNLTLAQTQELIKAFVTPIWGAINAGETFEGCWNPLTRAWGPAEPMLEPMLVPQRKVANDIGLAP